jgi:hypothetical protein
VTLPVRLSGEAVAELDDAATWYDEKRVGLGGEFVDAVEEALQAIVRWPRSGSLVDGVPADLEVRRLPVMRFPLPRRLCRRRRSGPDLGHRP